MATSRRTKGTGGLWTRTQKRLNVRTGDFEEVQVYQVAKEVPHPTEPSKRKWVTGTGATPTEAYKKLDKNLTRYYKKLSIPPAASAEVIRHGGQTLGSFLEEWHRELDPNRVSTQLQRKYWQYMKNHVIPHVGGIPIKDLNYGQLRQLFETTLVEKVNPRTNQPLLGNNARRNIYKVLKGALNVAVKKGTIDRNPLDLVTTPRYKLPEENIPQLVHVAQDLFQKLEEDDLDTYDHFISALMGLRRGERLGLSFSDLTLTGTNPKMTIRNQLSFITGQGIVLRNTTKSGKPRTVSLSEPWISSFKRLKAKRAAQKKLDTFNPKPEFEDLIFLKDSGKPYTLNEDNEYWNTVEAKLNTKQPHIRGHALRHIAATDMANRGVELEVAQAIFGHQSEAMAYYYRRITAQKQRSQVATYGSGWSRKSL
jgi:integrase